MSTTKKKILYHHRTLGDGAEGIHIREMVAAFRNLGHSVRVVALAGEGDSQAPAQKGRWSSVARFLPPAAYELAEIGYNVVGRQTIRKAVDSFRPDFIYDRYNSYSAAAVEVGQSHGLPVVLEVNAPVAYERMAYEKLPLRFPGLAQRYERAIFKRATRIIVVSTPLKEFLVEQRGVDEGRIVVMPNGADPVRFQPDPGRAAELRRQWGFEGRLVIGFVGILRPWHGVEKLVSVMERLVKLEPSAHLLLVGDGPVEGELKETVERLGIRDHVTFTGRVGRDAVRDYIHCMDIAASPKATFYASPMKILEYMAMGLPTVAPDMANIRDIITDGQEGVLFTPDDEESMFDRIRQLLEDGVARRRMGANARARIEQELNWRNNALGVMEIAEKLLT